MLATSMNYLGTGRRSYQMYGMNYGVRLDQGGTVEGALNILKRWRDHLGAIQFKTRGPQNMENSSRLIRATHVEAFPIPDPHQMCLRSVPTAEGGSTYEPYYDAFEPDCNGDLWLLPGEGPDEVALAEIDGAIVTTGAAIQRLVGQAPPVRALANHYPLTVSELRSLLTKQIKAYETAAGVSAFPTATVLLTIAGVAVIGGLTVWGVARRGRGPKRRRRR